MRSIFLRRLFSFGLATFALGCAHSYPRKGAFTVLPYIQLGPQEPNTESLQVLWHADSDAKDWRVEFSRAETKEWKTVPVLVANAYTHLPRIPNLHIFTAHLKPHQGGEAIQQNETLAYRIFKSDKVVFEGTAKTRKPKGVPVRFVVFGDCGANSKAERAIVYQVQQVKPDFVALTGDIVYSKGLMSEYYDNLFPMFTAEKASLKTGAPLLRSTLVFPTLGNHDVGGRELQKYPDGMAYFYNWSLPYHPKTVELPYAPPIEGTYAQVRALRNLPSFPDMANYSFDYGDTHWTMIDANPYVKWDDAKLQAWLRADLTAAQGAKWRFVALHHPAYNSSKAHFDDQKRMRVLDAIWAEGKVDIVFAGHVHNYQRSHPLRYSRGGVALDRVFDGKTNTRTEGVLHIITGGGGAGLYDPAQQDKPKTWQPFTSKFYSKVHSFSVVDVSGDTFTLRQINAKGQEVDRFTLTK